MAVTVKSRSKSLKDTELEISQNATLDAFLAEISKKNRNINTNRLRLTYQKESKFVSITTDELLKGEVNRNGDVELFVKDLGPQISWRLVFLVEYFGPIFIHSVFYYLSTLKNVNEKFHSSSSEYNPVLNKILYLMVIAHYLKREFESVFVHQFSNSTMPFFNLFKNSAHYWILNGMISFCYFGYGFLLSDTTIESFYNLLGFSNVSLLIALFTVSELWNLYIHVRLRQWGDTQKKLGNTTKRVAINDGVFKILVAPNYTFEVWAWIWFTVVSKFNLFSLIFLIVSATQMYLWAQKKNKKYGTKRAFLIPFIF